MAIVIPSSPQINNNERHFVSEYFTNLSNSTIDEEQPHEESPPASPLLDHKDRHAPPILRCYSDPTSGDDYSPPSSSSHSPPDSSPNYNMTCHTTPTSPQTSYRGISSLNAPPQPPITPIYDGDCTCHDCMTYAAMTISSQAPSRGESRYGTPRTSRAGSRAMSRSSIVSTPTNTSPTSSHRTLSTTTTRSSISSGNETPQELPDDPLDKDYIGPFKLGETLGKGQSGYVRVGRHVDTGFEAAFKIIDKNTLQNDPKQWHKIMREIVILKLMEHPHVLKLYDVLETKKNIYMVLEYVKGGELFQYIISKGRLDRHESLRLIAQLIQGLEHCHAYNISHRDLKPENILLDEQKNIKIADFGMALLTKRGQLQRTRCGSPHYVSPEVIEGRSYDPKVSDVWSVGVIFYAMLTGCHPFDHENVAVLLSLITQGKYSIPFYVDPDVTDLLRRMLVVEPSKRIELSAIKHHPVFKKKKYFIDAHITPPPCAPAVTPTIIVSDVAQAHTLEEQLDENVLKDLEALGLGWGTRDELRQKIVASSALNGEPSIEKCFYDRLLARRQSRRDELSRLSPRPMEPRIPHSPIPRTVRPTHHLSLPGPITIAGTALPRPPSTGMHVRRTSSTSSHLHDLKPVIHVSIPMNTDGYDDLEMPPGLPWGDGILIIPPSLHAATNHHQQIYQSMANHFAHSHHKNEHPHGHHHSPSPHHHHTHHSPSPHHHNQHSHHHHQQPSTPHHQPSSRNPHRHTVTSTTPGSTSISPSPAIHVSSNSNVCHTTPTSPRRHSITNETHKTVSFKHQHHNQTPRGQDNDEVSFSPFLSPFSSKPSSPPSTPPSTPKAKTRALEAAAASSDVTMTPFTISPPSSSHPIPMDETPSLTPTMMEQVRTIAYTRGEQRGSIKQNTINNKKTQVKSQPKSKSWFSSIFAVKPSLNIMSGGIPSTSRPPLQQPQSYVPQQPQQPQSQSHSQDVHMSDV